MLVVAFLVMGAVAGAFLLNWFIHNKRQAKLLRFKLQDMKDRLERQETPPDNPPTNPPGSGNKRK